MLNHLTNILASTPTTAKPGAFTTTGQMMAALGVLLLCFTMLSLLRRRIRRQTQQSGQNVQERIKAVRDQAVGRSGSGTTSPHVSAAARASVQSVMADAEELTRRLAALLDNKAAAIEVLIDRASEAAHRLEQANASAHAPVRHASPSPLPDPVADEVYTLADQGMTALDIARELDEPTGKIELMLALRQPNPAPTAPSE